MVWSWYNAVSLAVPWVGTQISLFFKSFSVTLAMKEDAVDNILLVHFNNKALSYRNVDR